MATIIIDIAIALLLFFSGFAAGYLAGLFGIGGGVVLVPVFLSIFSHFRFTPDIVMHFAIGTSLLLVIPASVVAVRKHKKLNNLDFEEAKRWLPAVIIGTFLGLTIFKFISPLLLKLIFTIYLYLSCIYLLIKGKIEFSQLNVSKKTTLIKTLPSIVSRLLFGFLIGGASILLGIGGGTFTVPYYRHYDYPIKKAIALSSLTAICIGGVGTVGAAVFGWGVSGGLPFSLGYVNLIAFIMVAPFMMLMAPLGAKAANTMDKRKLHWLYVAFLAFMAVYMTVQVLR